MVILFAENMTELCSTLTFCSAFTPTISAQPKNFLSVTGKFLSYPVKVRKWGAEKFSWALNKFSEKKLRHRYRVSHKRRPIAKILKVDIYIILPFLSSLNRS